MDKYYRGYAAAAKGNTFRMGNFIYRIVSVSYTHLMEDVIKSAKDNRAMYGRKTILFVDEIHRFNKGQQDYLLPFVEDGTIVLIGATTENPFFEVNGALLSRSQLFELKPLSSDDIKILIKRALSDKEKGMGIYNAVIDDDALAFLSETANGLSLIHI